jgi:hypothetical protein
VAGAIANQQKKIMNTNELLHTFGLYNAIVIAKDGTRVHWNNALEFAREVEPLDWPVVDISEYPDIQKAVEDFLQNGNHN